MILSTTPTIEGKPASVYLGVVASEIIFGAFFLKDWLAEGADFWGGRNRTYEKVFDDARSKALTELEAKATARGANAVVNLRFDYLTLGAANGMLMVAATGTAVAIPFTKEELAREEENTAAYFVEIDAKQRGPFSMAQLRELHANARIQESASTHAENGAIGPTVGELLSKPGPRL